MGNPLGVKGFNSLLGMLRSRVILATQTFPLPGHCRKICQLSHTLCLSTRDFHLNRCLQTPLSDFKKIGVFSSKIIFHLHNLNTAPWRVFNNGRYK